MLNTWHLLCLVVLHTRNIPQIHSYTSINRWYVWRTFTYTLSIYTINNNSTSFFFSSSFSIPLVSHFTRWSIINYLCSIPHSQNTQIVTKFHHLYHSSTTLTMKQLSSPLNTCIISPKKSSTPSMHSSNENDHHLISHDSSSHPSTLILKKRYDTKHCLARKLILARRTQGRRQIYLLFSSIPFNFIHEFKRAKTLYIRLSLR